MKNYGMSLVLAAGVLMVGSESCILSEKSVEVPLRGDTDVQFSTVGPVGTLISSVSSLDLYDEIQQVEQEGGTVEEVVDLTVESAYWRVVENRLAGSAATVTVSVLVWRNGVAPDSLVRKVPILLNEAETEFQPLLLDPAGLGQILQGFDEYVVYRNEGGVPPDLTYYFTLTTTTDQPLDVDWETRVKFTLVGVFKVDVPDPWD